MIIEPGTNVKILHDVPLDNEYQHTLYFENASAQQAYFSSKTKYPRENLTYQRKNSGKARIGLLADSLYDCNYMMFQNTNFGSKWFYAFITKAEYVNNNTTEITFEIDNIQTWLFDMNRKQCFVEREHSARDEIGDNLLPEHVDLGPYTTQKLHYTGLFNNSGVIIASNKLSKNVNPMWTRGALAGTFNGMYYYVGLYETQAQADALVELIDELADENETDSIVSVYNFPPTLTKTSNTFSDYSEVKETPITILNTGRNAVDHWVVRNKKLLTYPYCFLNVTTGGNNNVILKYEYFLDDNGNIAPTMEFSLVSSWTCPPKVTLIPRFYLGKDYNLDNQISISDFPQSAMAIDSFKAWLSQQSGANALAGLGSAALGVASAATGNPVGAIMGATGFAQAVNSTVVASTQTNHNNGSQTSNLMYAFNALDFYMAETCITKQYAMAIDEYFTMYGYATERVKVPNISSRPHFNYTKTKDCIITGKIPADDLKKICKIFDNGITFWKNADEVGDYTLNNSPV